MAVQAPSHAECLDLIDLPHGVDPPMAGNTTNPTHNVRAMVEIDVVGQVVHPDPPNRIAGFNVYSTN